MKKTKITRHAWAIDLGYLPEKYRAFAGIYFFSGAAPVAHQSGISSALFKTRALARAALRKMHFREKCKVVKVEVTVKAVS